MKTIIGFLVKKDGEVIGATSDKQEALDIAAEFKGLAYRVITIIDGKHDPVSEWYLMFENFD